MALRFQSEWANLPLSKHRIEALSDGLFAIVMTLLVLELKVPELPRSAPDGEILLRLRELGPSFFTFVLTFVLSALFWFLHQLAFQFTRHLTRGLTLLNLVFLMFVALLPFSAGMLGRFMHSQVAACIYYGNQFIIGTALCIQWEYARRHKLIAEGLDPQLERRLSFRFMRVPFGSAGAVAMALIQPDLAFTGFLGAMAIVALLSRKFSRTK